MKRLITAVVGAALLAAVTGAPNVVAGTDRPTKVLDFESIIVSLEADGTPINVRLVDTLRVIGEGDVTVTDTMPTEDFRVLSGFTSPEVGDGQVTYTIEDLQGEAEFISASTPDVQPQVSMLMTYYLDGERVEPEDIVGATGQVQIMFDVRNNTGEVQELTYRDADGVQQPFTEEVPIPMIGQLQMEADTEHVSNIEAPEAEKVTDSRGNITVLWNLVMVPPIGGTVQTAEILMDAEDFQMGAVRLLAVPVAPKDREFLEYAEDELTSGEDSAAGLSTGAAELSSSLDELHNGTLELLDGMRRLFSGAQELTAGLGDAFSGSGRLSSGLGQARAGSAELHAGLRDAEEGSGLITGGIGDLRGGLRQIGDGMDQLSQGLPAGQAGANDIATAADGITQIAQGLAANLNGSGESIKTGAQGIQSIVAGLAASVNGGGASIKNGILATIDCLTGTGSSCGGGGSISSNASDIGAVCGGIGATCTGSPIPTLAGAISAKSAGIVGGALAPASAGADAVAACLTGAGAPCSGNPSVNAIAASIAAGADLAAACLTGGGTPCEGNPSVAGIATLVQAGAVQLAAGVASAVAGVGQLAAGVDEAISGTTELFRGSSDLTSGLGDAVAGSGELTAGLSEAEAGSGELTAGLGDARDGSALLRDGIGEASGGTEQIEQGVYSVNELGVKEIARGARETAAELARSLALMKAQDQRAANESLTYGPPASDQAITVVGGSGIILTMDQLDNRGAESTGRAVGAGVGLLALVGLGLLGARALRREPEA